MLVAPPPGFVEQRIPIAAARDGGVELLALAHETLAEAAAVRRDADFLCVLRRLAPGRPVRDGRVPRELAPHLLLQAAAATAFFQAHGLSLGEEDLAQARWDRQAGVARLWLLAAPSPARGSVTPPCAVVADFLDRLLGRGGRMEDRQARSLRARLRGPESAFRRAEFAVASVLQSFPALAEEQSSSARRRCAGEAGQFLRDARARALAARGRALLEGRQARVFLPPGSALQAGGALGLDPPASSAAEASRRLRRLAEEDACRRPAVWIAAAPERWDALSRRAFETAARFHPPEVEVRTLPATVPAPRLPDQWRREIFVPCGSVAASLRFYEWFADQVREDPAAARDVALDCLGSPGWAAFASDPTGQAPLPISRGRGSTPAPVAPPGAAEREALAWLAWRETPLQVAEVAEACGRTARSALWRLFRRGLAEPGPSGWSATASGRCVAPSGAEAAALCRRWAGRETQPDRRIELLLRAGEKGEALLAAEQWVRGSPARPEAWFELAARLRAAGVERRPWLDAIEAEREIAGGRPAEAVALLDHAATSPGATREERRGALLREAEIRARVEGAGEAGRRALAWRQEFPEAPPEETLRALRLEAAGLARAGRHEEAWELLDRGDRLAVSLPETARIEQALARASALSLEGRFDEEARLYDTWRARAMAQGDDALAARFLSQEALGLCDRRRFAEAAACLEQGLEILRDDPAERARLEIDLAATLYHAGRTGRCETLLEEAAQLAACSGRRDLLRIARSNRIELRLARGEWDEAARAIEELLEAVRADADDLWLLVALHHRGRLALRRGRLGPAREDNARARDLAMRLRDRLEVGELWLEEGDRLLYEGDLDGARGAWEKAAADPPDRCDTERLAAARLEELAWSRNGGPPASARKALSMALARGEYAAAETAARWRVLLGAEGLAEELARQAESVLREHGGEALADRVFGSRAPSISPAALPIETLRGLREALARGLAREDAAESLEAVGIEGLCLQDDLGREVLRLGCLEVSDARVRELEAGSVSYRLFLPRPTSDALVTAAALLAETLLFRRAAAPAAEGFAAAWRRLGIVTEDPSMEEPYRRLQRFAAQSVTVLVRGESGSGKEAVARAVHALSPRASGPFVAVNVPAIPAALLESELFGHVRGAFTGAERDRVGLLEEAARGTIFFDEIGDLEPALQSKLLRALQDREIRRLGDNRSRRIDVRVVSATARDLSREVETGRFREDLFYRLHVAVIALPPLRGRGRDVLALARHFLEGFGREYGRGPLRLSPEALVALSAHAWPGNVRELQNAMAQAAALADSDGVIGVAHLPEALVARRADAPARSYRYRLDAHRKGMISDALERAGGNRSLAARELGLSRQALRYLMKELHVASPPAPLPAARPPRA